jgi:hypothetical protein
VSLIFLEGFATAIYSLKAITFPSGHWLMEEKPAETSAALKDFFGN